ncbi:hypothetical protein TNCV_5030921 [Trichonephila clavipes]|nr:hypothetical protein TNCV_5030921 [Trichonephila clavipes]
MLLDLNRKTIRRPVIFLKHHRKRIILKTVCNFRLDGSEEAFPSRKSEVDGSIPVGVAKFFGCENRRHHPKITQNLNSGATAHEGLGLLCPSQYTGPLGAVVHEQMSRSGGQSEARLPVLKSPSSLVLIYHPTAVGMKVESTWSSPGIEPGPVGWKHDILPLDHRASSEEILN